MHMLAAMGLHHGICQSIFCAFCASILLQSNARSVWFSIRDANGCVPVMCRTLQFGVLLRWPSPPKPGTPLWISGFWSILGQQRWSMLSRWWQEADDCNQMCTTVTVHIEQCWEGNGLILLFKCFGCRMSLNHKCKYLIAEPRPACACQPRRALGLPGT